MPAEHFFQDAALQQAQLSPSGRWLAAIAGGGGLRLRLVILDVEGQEPARVVAVFKAADVSRFDWVNDDWLVFEVASPEDTKWSQRGPGLISVRRDGQQQRLLIQRQFFHLVHGEYALSTAHRLLGLGPAESTEVVVGESHYDNHELKYVSLKLLDVATGGTSARVPIPRPPSNAKEWWFDHAGQPRVLATRRDGRTALYWADRKSESWKRIAEFSAGESAIWPSFIDSNDQLYVTVESLNAEARLHRFDFGSGTVDPQPVLSTPGFDVRAWPILDGKTGALHGFHHLTEGMGTTWLEPAMRQIQDQVDKALPDRINQLSCRPCDRPKVVLVHSYSDRDPGRYFLIRPGAAESFQRLGSARPDIDPARMARLEFHRTKARDGSALPLWITALPQAAPAPRPAVVMVHGGPWLRGVTRAWHQEAQFLASRGYVVIEPEFRGSTGFGDAHFRAGWRQWGQAMQDDVSDALRFAVDRGLVDPRRVCIVGSSYGGYSALMGLVRDPDHYRCAVAWIAVTDPRLMYEYHGSGFSLSSKLYYMPLMMGDPKTDAAMLARNSPLEQASMIKAPVLLAYGAKDGRVPIIHGERMRDALAAAGNPPEWIVYDTEGHGWGNATNRIDFWKRVEAFLARHTAPAPR